MRNLLRSPYHKKKTSFWCHFFYSGEVQIKNRSLREELETVLDRHKQDLTNISQIQELASMLQECHGCVYSSLLVIGGHSRYRGRPLTYVKKYEVWGLGCLHNIHLNYCACTVEPQIKDTIEITSEHRTRFNVPNGDFPIVLNLR